MKYSEKEIVARKQMAMAAANYLINEGFAFVTVSITRTRAEVTVFVDSIDLLSSAKHLSLPFMIDGASRESGDGVTSAGDHYYYLTLEWL